MIPIEVTARGKFLGELVSRTSRMAGNARYAGPAKRCSDSLDNRLRERGDFSSLWISSGIHGFAPVGFGLIFVFMVAG
jgi:hypothetical protein